MDKEFKKFLRKHKAYDLFKLNTLRDISSLPDISEYFKTGRAADYIDRAFTWSDTKEGHDFWEKLHDEWRDIVKKI